MTTAPATRMVRVADKDENYDTRRGLRELRQRLEPPPPPRQPEKYAVQTSARPANVVVALPVGAGDDPGALAAALKLLKKEAEKNGLAQLLNRKSRLFVYEKPSVRRRRKEHFARLRAAKRTKKAAWDELRGV